jgi:hypothetical protein
MNRKIKIIGVAVAMAVMSTSGAAWADCGLKPNVPAAPTASPPGGKEMEEYANAYDTYQTAFIEFSNCINKEFEESQATFKAALDAYQEASKKK